MAAPVDTQGQQGEQHWPPRQGPRMALAALEEMRFASIMAVWEKHLVIIDLRAGWRSQFLAGRIWGCPWGAPGAAPIEALLAGWARSSEPKRLREQARQLVPGKLR